ncbi:MAG: hypothetical protein GY736_10465, partial [Sphingomonas sp.]|uniref:hypothetical protein n=3 Tax=Pseudomonadota TaxID=1224 RepID=UPI00258A38F5
MRFLAVFLVAWIGVRVALLWPQIDSAADVLRAVVPVPVAVIPPESPVVASEHTAKGDVRRWYRAAAAKP